MRVWQHAIVARNCDRAAGAILAATALGRPGRALSPRLVTATMQLLPLSPRRLCADGSAPAVFYYIAYFLVHSLAVSSYLARSALQKRAISGTSGSSGFGSVSSEQMERMTLLVVSAGDHCALRMSRQMLPLLFTLGW